jgi:hypothetical protein
MWDKFKVPQAAPVHKVLVDHKAPQVHKAFKELPDHKV